MRRIPARAEQMIYGSSYTKLFNLESALDGEASSADLPPGQLATAAPFTHAIVSQEHRFDWRQNTPWRKLLANLTEMETCLTVDTGSTHTVAFTFSSLLTRTDLNYWGDLDVSNYQVKFYKHRDYGAIFEIYAVDMLTRQLTHLFSVIPLYDLAGETPTLELEKKVCVKLLEYLGELSQQEREKQRETDDQDIHASYGASLYNLDRLSSKLKKGGEKVLFTNTDRDALMSIENYLTRIERRSKVRKESFPAMFAAKFPLLLSVKSIIAKVNKEIELNGEVYGKVA